MPGPQLYYILQNKWENQRWKSGQNRCHSAQWTGRARKWLI